MVFDLDSEALVGGVERRPFGYGPGLEDPIEFKAQIVMQARRIVPLDDEAQTRRRAHPDIAARFRGFLEVAPRLVVGERRLFGHKPPPIDRA